MGLVLKLRRYHKLLGALCGESRTQGFEGEVRRVISPIDSNHLKINEATGEMRSKCGSYIATPLHKCFLLSNLNVKKDVGNG
ncbi:MAG: hypothetical protein AAGJ08_08025 [Cyanobacteria bacterium P01_H01_bin.35]